MGPFLGFMVGFFDAISNIIYVSLFIRFFILCFVFVFHITYEPKHLPYMWVIVSCVIVVTNIGFGKFNFWFMTLGGLFVLLIPLMFICGTTKLYDYQLYVVEYNRALQHVFMPLGARGFLRLLPAGDVFYFGIDMIPLVCEDAKNVRKVIAIALLLLLIYY